MSQIDLKPNKSKGGRRPVIKSRVEIEQAISVTQSMRQAAIYLNLSYNVFRREAKRHNLWNPGKPQDGSKIKRVHSGKISSEMLLKILRGERLMSYRETMLLKKAFDEKYLTQICSNCGADFCHIVSPETPPLVLDFLDRDTSNGKQDNLRVLCLNCVYSLKSTHKGWYRHREVPLNQVIDDELPPEIEVKEEELEWTPFEKFQKTLDIDENSS